MENENDKPELTPAEKESADLIDTGHCLESAAEKIDMPVPTAAWRLRKARKLRR